MIRDRGRIKWTSMMLPEHVKILREWAEEDQWEQKKQPDEQKLELMDERVHEALETEKTVLVEYYENHSYHRFTGKIVSFDILSKHLRLADQEGMTRSIPLEAIDQLEFADRDEMS